MNSNRDRDRLIWRYQNSEQQKINSMKNDTLQLCMNYLKITISSIKKEQNIKRYYNVVYYSTL